MILQIQHLTTGPGIYAIRNVASGKTYIGSAKNIKARLNRHREDLRANMGTPNTHLQLSWNKHGERAFVVEILELCEIDALTCREQFAVDQFLKNNKRSLLYNRRTEIIARNNGVRHTQETKDKIRGTLLGHVQSTETKKKRSLTLRKVRGRKITLSSGIVFGSIAEFDEWLGVKAPTAAREFDRGKTPDQVAARYYNGG